MATDSGIRETYDLRIQGFTFADKVIPMYTSFKAGWYSNSSVTSCHLLYEQLLFIHIFN